MEQISARLVPLLPNGTQLVSEDDRSGEVYYLGEVTDANRYHLGTDYLLVTRVELEDVPLSEWKSLSDFRYDSSYSYYLLTITPPQAKGDGILAMYTPSHIRTVVKGPEVYGLDPINVTKIQKLV